jgi:hypothetical protein
MSCKEIAQDLTATRTLWARRAARPTAYAANTQGENHGQKCVFRHLETRRARLRAAANGLPNKTTSPNNNYLCRTDERACSSGPNATSEVTVCGQLAEA